MLFQGLLSFTDVFVHFTCEEWRLLDAAWLLKPGGVGVAFVKYLGILDLCLEARFSLCLFGIRIRQLNDHYFAKYQRGAL